MTEPPIAAVSLKAWPEKDDASYTAAANDHQSFRTKPMDADDQYSFTFTHPGTYPYFCSIRPRMTAKIIVQAS